jgi:hypothetical protein
LQGVAAAMRASEAAAASDPAARAGGAAGGNLLGVGMAPEGVEQNPVVYEFMAEMAYGDTARCLAGGAWTVLDTAGGCGSASGGEMDAWFEGYAARRYAAAGAAPPAATVSLAAAWRRLGRTAYACRDRMHATVRGARGGGGQPGREQGCSLAPASLRESGCPPPACSATHPACRGDPSLPPPTPPPQVCDIPTSRPGLSRAEIVGWGLAPHVWYPLPELAAALRDLLAAAAAHPPLATSSAFRYDVIDAARELLSKGAGALWAGAAAAFAARDGAALDAAGSALLALLADLDALLGCHEGFMLGPALARARAFAAPGLGGGGDAGGAEGSAAAEDGASGGRRRWLGLMYEWSLRTQVKGSVLRFWPIAGLVSESSARACPACFASRATALNTPSPSRRLGPTPAQLTIWGTSDNAGGRTARPAGGRAAGSPAAPEHRPILTPQQSNRCPSTPPRRRL